jgi:hypothetical protein
MTPREIAIAKALKEVSFPPATWAKRFARDMAFLAENSPEKELTQKQADALVKTAYRYRRQMPAHLGYPLVDDGSAEAAAGHEKPDAAPIQRPLSKRDATKAEREARRAAAAAAAQNLSPQLPLEGDKE